MSFVQKGAKNNGHVQTSQSFIQGDNNVKSNKGAKVKLPKLGPVYMEWGTPV